MTVFFKIDLKLRFNLKNIIVPKMTTLPCVYFNFSVKDRPILYNWIVYLYMSAVILSLFAISRKYLAFNVENVQRLARPGQARQSSGTLVFCGDILYIHLQKAIGRVGNSFKITIWHNNVLNKFLNTNCFGNDCRHTRWIHSMLSHAEESTFVQYINTTASYGLRHFRSQMLL